MPGRDPNEFAKNMLIANSANNSDLKPGGQEVEIVACPSCGKEQERKPGAVCVKCKRLIPRLKARQGWEQKKKILYAGMEQYFEKEEEDAEVKFERSRKGPSVLDHVRTAVLVAGLGATLYLGVPMVIKATMGVAAYNKIQKGIQQSVTGLFKPKPAPAPPKRTRRH